VQSGRGAAHLRLVVEEPALHRRRLPMCILGHEDLGRARGAAVDPGAEPECSGEEGQRGRQRGGCGGRRLEGCLTGRRWRGRRWSDLHRRRWWRWLRARGCGGRRRRREGPHGWVMVEKRKQERGAVWRRRGAAAAVARCAAPHGTASMPHAPLLPTTTSHHVVLPLRRLAPECAREGARRHALRV
jgi:hypothetical protein